MERKNIYLILKQVTDKTLSGENHRKVLRWLIHTNHEAEKESALEQIWYETDSSIDKDINHSLQQVHQKLGIPVTPHIRRFRLQRLLPYVAVFLLLIVTGYSTWYISRQQLSSYEMVEYFVPYGEVRTIELPDGSLAELNAGTLLIYPEKFTSNKRSVYLSGEANFSVVRDVKRPFTVRTGPLYVEVLGTKFNIQSYTGSGHIITTLEQGAVKVYPENDPFRSFVLQPDEQLTYLMKDSSFHLSRVEAKEYSSWISGELRFLNKPIEEIIETLERRYNVNIMVDPAIYTDDLLTMKFRAHETVEDALHIFCALLGKTSYSSKGKTIYIHPAGKEVNFK